MTPEEAFARAWKEAPRQDDGSIAEAVLIDLVAERLDVDAAALRHQIATRVVQRKRRPGTTAPEGQLTLPGMEPYAYEPERLIGNERGEVIENAKARPNYKLAEARRAQANLRRVMNWAERKQEEASLFANWAYNQLSAGRAAADIVFEVFIRETQLWKPDQAPPEEGPGDEPDQAAG